MSRVIDLVSGGTGEQSQYRYRLMGLCIVPRGPTRPGPSRAGAARACNGWSRHRLSISDDMVHCRQYLCSFMSERYKKHIRHSLGICGTISYLNALYDL